MREIHRESFASSIVYRIIDRGAVYTRWFRGVISGIDVASHPRDNALASYLRIRNIIFAPRLNSPRLKPLTDFRFIELNSDNAANRVDQRTKSTRADFLKKQ